MRQLILLCDGTNNNLSGGEKDTHVVRLAEVLSATHPPQGTERLVYYDPGVGNPAHTPGTSLTDKLHRLKMRVDGLAFGHGIYENITEGYLFLMRNYRAATPCTPADQLWFFGFSRGAFTARSIAGLVNRFGILPPHLENLVPTLLHVYFAEDPTAVAPIARQIECLFTQQPPAPPKPFIHFVGVWDTVASVGWGPFAMEITATAGLKDKRFVHVRQALALDEHRLQFAPRVYAEPNGDIALAEGKTGTLVQLWFRGNHCDVGGGHPQAESALSRTPFVWLLDEAIAKGLALHHSAGQPLDAQQAWALLQEKHDQPLIHSELQRTPWWAVAGVQVRDTFVTLEDKQHPQRRCRITMEEHPSAAQSHPSVWPQCVVNRCWWMALVLLVILWALQGCLLKEQALPAWDFTWAGLWPWLWACVCAVTQSVWAFQHWQWAAWGLPSLGGWMQQGRDFAQPAWAVFWDLGVIAAYTRLLAPLYTHHFAKATGWLRTGTRVPQVLNLLGLAFPCLVLADLAENLLTWAALATIHLNQPFLSAELGVAVALASAVKWLGFAGVLCLILGWRAVRLRVK